MSCSRVMGHDKHQREGEIPKVSNDDTIDYESLTNLEATSCMPTGTSIIVTLQQYRLN
jgi:hypothetical protein